MKEESGMVTTFNFNIVIIYQGKQEKGTDNHNPKEGKDIPECNNSNKV